MSGASSTYQSLPLCPTGCECRVGSDDPDRHECGCDGPCTTWAGSVVRYVEEAALAGRYSTPFLPQIRRRWCWRHLRFHREARVIWTRTFNGMEFGGSRWVPTDGASDSTREDGA